MRLKTALGETMNLYSPNGLPDPKITSPAKVAATAGADHGDTLCVATYPDNNNTCQLIDAIIANALTGCMIQMGLLQEVHRHG
jgi:hypothetical protein